MPSTSTTATLPSSVSLGTRGFEVTGFGTRFGTAQKNVFTVLSLEFVAGIDFFLVHPEIGKAIPSAAGLLVAAGPHEFLRFGRQYQAEVRQNQRL
jgi:hypothetical protein